MGDGIKIAYGTFVGVGNDHLAAIKGLQGVDGGGDLQKIKEELETLVLGGSPEMLTDTLYVTTAGQEDTIAAPGDGHHLEVYGFAISIWHNASIAIVTNPAHLSFETSSKDIWKGSNSSVQSIEYSYALSGIRVVGGNNEALTLQNATFGTAGAWMDAVVFYRDITD